MLNYAAWDHDPDHADDNRWMHRPRMDWAAAERRSTPGTVEQRCFDALRRLGEARRTSQAFRSDGRTTVLPVDNPHVLAYVRSHPRAAPLMALANFSDAEESVALSLLGAAGFSSPMHLHSTAGRIIAGDGRVHLPAWGFLWVTNYA
jgi:amylosucrase